jgi:hypothetical protein
MGRPGPAVGHSHYRRGGVVHVWRAASRTGTPRLLSRSDRSCSRNARLPPSRLTRPEGDFPSAHIPLAAGPSGQGAITTRILRALCRQQFHSGWGKEWNASSLWWAFRQATGGAGILVEGPAVVFRRRPGRVRVRAEGTPPDDSPARPSAPVRVSGTLAFTGRPLRPYPCISAGSASVSQPNAATQLD